MFFLRVWRNWQLGEGARPVGDEATSTRRKNKERRDRRERVDYVLSRLAQSFFIYRICGCGGIGRRARFRILCSFVQVQVLSPVPIPPKGETCLSLGGDSCVCRRRTSPFRRKGWFCAEITTDTLQPFGAKLGSKSCHLRFVSPLGGLVRLPSSPFHPLPLLPILVGCFL